MTHPPTADPDIRAVEPLVTTLPDSTAPADSAPRAKSRSIPGALIRKPAAVVSVIVLLIFVFAAVFAHLVAPYDPAAQDPVYQLLPPFWVPGGTTKHLMGTDELGRDMLSRLIYGARTAMALAFAAASISAVVGTVLGVLSGMYERVLGSIIMWLCDSQLAFPYIVLALVVITARGSSFGNLLFILGIFGWVQFARVVRAEVLRVKQMDFVLAAQGNGGSGFNIMRRHILPNVISPVIVLWTFSLASVLVLESALGFLGLGVQPPTSDWGQLFATGRTYILSDWWYCLLPGLAITITVVCSNVLGRSLRIILNPRTR
jgi:peptide/nickel transport system permease protein